MRDFFTWYYLFYYLVIGALGVFIVSMLLVAIDIIVGWFKDDNEK